jgi:BON domain-containing protein
MAYLRAHTSWLSAASFAAAVGTAAMGAACREEPAAQHAPADGVDSPADIPAAPVRVPHEPAESAGDGSIRRQLNAAIEQDPSLKDRVITFTVINGDVTVTGTVRTEIERQRMNELAMQIDGVKSVANSLRVAPG